MSKRPKDNIWRRKHRLNPGKELLFIRDALRDTHEVIEERVRLDDSDWVFEEVENLLIDIFEEGLCLDIELELEDLGLLAG